MNDFFTILKVLVAERGIDILSDSRKCASFLIDYARGEYKGERQIFEIMLKDGFCAKLKNANDRNLCKIQLAKQLQDERFIAPDKATEMVQILASVLFNEPFVVQTVPQIQKSSPAPVQQNNTSFTDPRDGQTYRTVKIGSQVWIAENLNYKTASGSWYYENDSDYGKKYGLLYDWKIALKVAPAGWHLPSDEEWKILEKNVGVNAGTKLKAKGGWNNSGNGTDDYSFSALPGGYRYFNGSFHNVGSFGYWWSATEYISSGAFYRLLLSGSAALIRNNDNDEENGYSVRCVRD